MKILLLLLSTALLLTSLSFADYTPPVKRRVSTIFQGHNAKVDESARSCYLDTVILRNGTEKWAMLFFWSDPISKLAYRVNIPTKILPLTEGSAWEDFNGNKFHYTNGEILGEKIKSADEIFDIQIQIDNKITMPQKAKAQQQDESGFSNTYLSCEF